MSVDLPAPFSPTMPWIVPRSTVRFTSRLAWTSPKRLLMAESWMAADMSLETSSRPTLEEEAGIGKRTLVDNTSGRRPEDRRAERELSYIGHFESDM
jgi:hypothetical protein